MTITKLPSGRYRAQAWTSKGWVSVPKIVGGPRSYATRNEAQRAKFRAQDVLAGRQAKPQKVTVREFWEQWTTDPLFQRPSESTNKHYKERTKGFVEAFGDLALTDVGDLVVARWLKGGKRNNTVPTLRTMFSDAASAKAGRLVQHNPFTGLGLEKSSGNKHKSPPTAEQAWQLIGLAKKLTPMSFCAYLLTACFSAARPGELDALKWTDVDFKTDEILIERQWNAKVGKFTPPKHRHVHTVTLTPPVKECLQGLRHDSEFCFTSLRGHHYTPSTRTHHWNRVRCAAGMGDVTLYLATRHFFGWYAVNVLGLETAVVAVQLGHRDGGKLVETLYGHPDERLRRQRINAAFQRTGRVIPLRRSDSA